MGGPGRLQLESEYRRRIRALVPDGELHEFSRPSSADTAFALFSIWTVTIALLIAADFALALPTLWAILASCALVVFITTRVNAMSVIIHEAAHRCLNGNRIKNDLIGNVGAAWWILNSVEGYRATHMLHHRYLHTSSDPDLGSYLVPRKAIAIVGRFAQDLLGYTGTRRAVTLVRSQGGTTSLTRSALQLVGMLVCQLVLLALLVAPNGVLVGVVAYVIFWLVPIACLFPVLLRVKTITEHFDSVIRSDPGTVLVSRTSASGRLQDWLIGARMEYHFEHHVFPAIPYRGLQRLHRTLVERGFFDMLAREEQTRIVSGGYVQYAASLVSDRVVPPGSARSATAAPAGSTERSTPR